MGMFKELRELNKTGKELRKEMRKMPGGIGGLKTLREGVAEAGQAMQRVQGEQILAESLANEGVDGMATIVQMVATGVEVNLQPELQFELTVDVNGIRSDVTHTQVVSPAIIGRLQPGAQVPVRVDPRDHSRLMIGLAG